MTVEGHNGVGSGERAQVRRLRAWVASARGDDLFLYAAALAFYGLISVAPLVVVALWVTSLVVGPAEVHHVADDLARLAPPALGADRALIEVARLGTTLGLMALAVALWPATAYGSALVRVLDRMGGDRTTGGLRQRGSALLLVGLVPVLVLCGLVAAYAGSATLGDSDVEIVVGLAVGLVAGFAAAVAAVAIVYRAFPRSPPEWRATLRGALMAAGSISVLSAGYVAYLRLGANFERRYASDALGALVLLGFWLFAANTALLVGYRLARRSAASGEEQEQPDDQQEVARADAPAPVGAPAPSSSAGRGTLGSTSRATPRRRRATTAPAAPASSPSTRRTRSTRRRPSS